MDVRPLPQPDIMPLQTPPSHLGSARHPVCTPSCRPLAPICTAPRCERAGVLSHRCVPGGIMPQTPQSTLIAAFSDRYEAELAVRELEESGFSPDEVGFALRGSDVAR